MNEQAIQDAYNLFVSNGYKKTLADFKNLIATNPQALQDSYNLFVSNGYGKDLNQFKTLMGVSAPAPAQEPVKKKEATGLSSEGGSSVSLISDKYRQPQQIQRDATYVKPPVMPMGGPKPVNLSTTPQKPSTPVKPQPVQEEQGYGDYLFNSLALGAAAFNEAVFSIPETVLNIFAIPQNLVAEATGWNIGTNAEQFKDYLGVKNPLLDWVKEDKKILSGEVSNYVAKNYKESGIVNNFANGNYQDGFEQLGASIAQSVPISVGIMMGGAYAAPEALAAATTVGLTEGQREELRQMDPNMKESELMMKALGMSAAESVFSAIGTGTIGQVYRDIAAREGKEAAAGILKDGLVQTYKKALEKGGMAVGFAGEGIEEAATQITQNVISGKPAFENVADAFVTGAGSGVVFTAPISAANAKNYIKNKAETYATKDKVGEILKENANNFDNLYNVPVGTSISPEQLEIANLSKSRDLLVNNLKKGVEENKITPDDAKQSLYVFDKIQQVSNAVKDLDVSAEDKAKIATLLSQRNDLKAKIENQDDVLVVQEKQQIEQINKQIQEIILKPKEDAVQKQSTDEGLLRSEGPQVGLQEMGEGNKGPQVTTEALKKEEVGPKYVKDISVLITPATVRGFDENTKRMQEMSLKYDELVKKYTETKDEALIADIRGLEEQILNDTKQEIIDKVATVPGTKVAFKDHKMGAWDGKFEPAFNMTLSITPQANTKELSDMLFDFSEKYSQDAFILESDSDNQESVFNDTMDLPLTEEKDGLLYYPQIGYTFAAPVSREKQAELSNKLRENGIDAFNMNDNEVKVSVITFGDTNLSPDEQYNQKYDEYKRQSEAIATAVKEVLGPDALGGRDVKIRRSKYTGATNEGTADQTRTYDRGDVFEAFQTAPTEVENLAKEYNTLRQKQIELSKEKQQLTLEEQDRLDELAALVQPTVEKTFDVNKKLYEDAKVEAETIAAEATKGLDSFISGFPIKRPSRASIKTMRWYGGFTEKLGDGARLNIIVKNPADVDKVYNEINKKYPTTDPDLRRLNENTELGYPKRLIEVRTSNGVIAEMQVMTPQAYLAKDGINGFQGQKEFAQTELKNIQQNLGWAIPDGLGHYFYEIQRDFNVDNALREEATALSNKYYEAFTNPESKLTESFMDEVAAFKDKVDAADKTNWDRGNEGIAPESLEAYLESRPETQAATEDVLTADNTDKTTLEKTLAFLDKVENDLDAFGRGNLSMGVAIPVMKAIIKTVKALVKTGITLQEAIKRAAAENNVSEQDVVDTIKAVAEMRVREGKAEAATEMELPGYNRMQKELEGIIEKSRARGTTEEKAMQNAIDYLQKSRVYQDATDVQREQMVRDVRKTFGKREKAAPKPEKLFGDIKDVKNITMSEKELLKKQLMDKARGAKDAKKAWMQTSAALAKAIKSMIGPGKITTKQAAVALRKFSGVNMFDENSISRFVDYMAKVFKNAEYAEQISAISKALPIARKNVQSKIGIAESVAPQMMRLFSIKPSLIPDAVFDKYAELVAMMGERKTVLKLDEITKIAKDVDDILTAVNEEVSLAEELADMFESYDGKVIDEDGKLDYAATIKKMVEEEVITEEEAAIMKKYKSKVLPMVERVAKTEEESAEEKEILVKAAQQAEVTTTELPTQDERKVARDLARLAKTDAVKGLDNSQLKNLLRVIDNINNGFLPHFAELMVERLNAINNAKDLTNAVKTAKPLKLSAVYSKLKSLVTKKDAISELIRRNPLYYIDQVFGNFKTKAIFNSLFEKAADAQARYSSAVTELQNRLDKAEEAVSASFKKDANKTLMSKFKMMTYMVQLEKNSNPDSKQVNPAAEYLQATIDHIEAGKSSFGKRDADMLQEILDKYSVDGQIDADKLYESFNPAEKKAIKTIQDINESMRDKAVFTAAIIRGDKINPLNNYVHLNTLHEHRPDEAISGVAFVDSYNNSMRPSTKAKSLIERTGKVAPLNFDVFASANRGAKFTLMDYYLTEPIRTARKTINETSKMLKEGGKPTEQQRDIFNAIDRAFEESVDNLLTQNFTATSFGDDVVNFISRQGYRAMLASLPRFAAELTSNLGFALVMAPKDFATGVKNRDIVLSADAVKVLNNVESKQTNRLFPNDTLSGKLVDTSILNQASGIKGGRAQNDVANKIQQIYNLSGKKYTNLVELGADALIATPDKVVMRPLWFGTFANEFKKATGKDVDFNKIASNDETYMANNRDAIEASRMAADEKSVAAGASDNAFMGILKGSAKPNQSAMLRGFNMFNSFMTRFLIYEYVTARTGIMAAIGNGSVSKKQGAAMLAAVATRMTMYTLLSSTLAAALTGLFVDDEDEENEKSLLQKTGQAMASSATSLLLGRDFGNATKGLINYGVERANEEYLDFLREGEYDPYKDALQYTIVPPDKKGKKTDAGDLLMNMMGPFGPAAKTADLAIRKATEDDKKEADAIARSEKETAIRLPLEVLGNLGMIPLYKDVRKVVNAELYKDISKAADEPNTPMMNKTEMQRYNPELYNQLYGPESPTYEIEQFKKEMKKEKERMRREMMDEMYQYTPKRKD